MALQQDDWNEPEFGFQRGHKFDRDAVCQFCGFDAAEWSWLRVTTPEHERDGSRMPVCEKTPP